MAARQWRRPGALACALLAGGCSIRGLAVRSLADAIAQGGEVFAADDDPELVRAAAPFSLKLMEGLLAEEPSHAGLLLAAAKGFTQYSYAFVQQDLDRAEEEDAGAAAPLRARARRLYLRGREYALQGLEAAHPGFRQGLRRDPAEALAQAGPAEVPLLYWAAAAWGGAIGVAKDDPELVADHGLAAALVDRALALDETFGEGALHGFLITYEMVREGAAGDPAERSRAHFRRAVELSGGGLAAPYVALAEAVAVPRQDRAEFEELLRRVLELDPAARPGNRLENLVLQERARWLLGNVDRLFL